ncbi:MAG: outer membrane protein TolC [Saprospiraceae bacterium]|jgi:outer membrane protein TolC
MKLKFLMSVFLVTIMGISANSQNLTIRVNLDRATIDECYLWSRDNFPLTKQMDIIDKTTQFTLSNASKANLPQINLNGQASYQSDVTSLPIEIPNMEIPTIDKDQYKIYGELYQPLTNFSNVNIRKQQIELSGEIEKQKVEVDLYQLKARINQLYFGVLLIDEKIEQFEIIQSDLDSALAKVETAIANGTATLTDKRLLNVERISIDQQIEENKSNQLAFLQMLSTLTGKNISESTVLEKPIIQVEKAAINRPELRLFSLQNAAITIQEEQLNNSLMPNIGLFGQGGYGRPALNFLSNEFEFYYMAGVKINWNLSSLYRLKNTKKILSVSNDKIANQREAFLLNTELTQSQQSAEITKYQGLIKSDNEIITIREEILKTAKVQLDNGIITTIDYVKFLNDVNKAKQTFLLHETQLLLAQYNLKTTTGN